MADSKTIQINLKAVSDFKDVISNVKQLQQAISGLSLPNNLESQFTKIFSNIEKNINKASTAMESGFKTKSSVTAYENATNQIAQDWRRIASIISGIDTKKLNFEIDSSQAKQVADDIARIKQEINQLNTSNLDKVKEAFESKPKSSTSSAWQDFFEAFKVGGEKLGEAETALSRLEKQVEKAKKAGKDFSEGSNWSNYEKQVTIYRQALNQTIQEQEKLNQKEREQNELQSQANDAGARYIEKLAASTRAATDELDKYNKETQEGAANTQKLGSEIDQFKHRIEYFFGLNNAVRLFQRGIRSAYETIKDLDKVMTETAVVTKFDVGDMWSQLPEYTQRANELGISIHDAYEAATLYYQQGLQTNEVMAVSNETLKMARIAGLDAAEATDRMTNALRGFNMEITNANAQNINDVYSNLAAKTASNVDEISTAMTKVASLANNANMSFENTAAFLSQIIETTRESAETAGTALKTVIARFSEVKNLYSEGELLGELEGEEIDVNKVSKALRTAGINLNEYLTGMKGLDQIFMELSERWDSLDQVQQRYIATMAAGSRQQSRFIALMQDNARMTQLVAEANSAAGASQGQFEKTLESLQSKLAQLKNAWDTFLMGLANDSVVKSIIDLLTNIITAVNKLTSSLPGLAKSIANIGVAIGGLNLSKGILKKIFPNLVASFLGKGKEAGEGFNLGLKESLQHNGSIFNGDFWKDLFRVPPIDVSGIEAIAIATEAQVQAEEELIRVNGEVTASNTWASASEELYSDQMEASFLATEKNNAAIAEKNLALMKAGLTQAEYDGLVAAGYTQEELAVYAELKRKGALEGLTEAQIKEKVAEEAGYKTKQKGIIGTLAAIVHTKAEAVAKKAETGSLWGNVAAWIADKTAIDATTGSMLAALGVIGLIIAAVALLVVGIVAVVNAMKDSTPEAKLEAAKEAAEAATDAAEKTAEAYDNLGQSFDALGERYNKLEELTEGTKEWKKAVQEVNAEVLELIEKYPELGAFVGNKSGVLKIDYESDSVQEVLDSYSERAIRASIMEIGARQRVGEASVEAAWSKVSNFGYSGISDFGVVDKLALALAGDQSTLEEFNVQRGDYTTEQEYFEALLEATGAKVEEAYLTEEEIKQLHLYGQALIENRTQMEGLSSAQAASIIQLSNLSEETSKYASTFLNSQMIDAYKKRAEEEIGSINGENRDRYRKEYAQILGYERYADYKADHNNKDISDEDLRVALVADKTVSEASKNLEAIMKEIAGPSSSEALRHLYSRGEGGGLTTKDISTITGKTTEEIAGLTVEEIKEKIEGTKLFSGLDLGEDELVAAQQYLAEALKHSADTFVRIANIIDNPKIQDWFNKGEISTLGAEQKEILANSLAEVYSKTGEEATLQLMSSIDAVMEQSGEYADDFVSALNTLDWSTIEDAEDLANAIDDMGIPINTSTEAFNRLAHQLLLFGSILPKIDIEGLSEKIAALGAVVSKIRSGKATITEKEYAAMVENGVSSEVLSLFQKNLDGEYVYLRADINELRSAIEDATRVEEENGRKLLEGRLGAQNQLKEFNGYEALASGSILNKDSNSKRNFLKSALGMLDETQLEAIGIEANGRTAAQIAEDFANTGKIDEVLTALSELVKEEVESELQQYNAEIGTRSRLLNYSLQENALEAGGNEYAMQAFKTQLNETNIDLRFFDEYYEKLDSGAEAIRAINAEKLAAIARTYEEAEALGIDTQKLLQYTEQLQKVAPALQNDKELALEVALANTKLNSGLSEIISSYKDWTLLLNENEKLTELANSDDIATFNRLKSSVEKMLNVTGDLSDDFWSNKKAMAALKSAAEGDVEALEYLQKVAAYDYLIHVEPDYVGTDKAIMELADFILGYDLPTLEAGATLDDTNFINALNEMIKKSGLGANKVNEMLGRIGYKAKVSWDTATQEQSIPMIDKRFIPNRLNGRPAQYTDTGGGGHEEVRITYKTIKTSVRVPRIESIISTGTAGGGVSHSNISNGKSNKPTGGKSSGKKSNGKSGSSSTPSYWKNPYDELYNLQEKINEALRRREALERKYQKLLKEQTTSIHDIRKGYYDQINALRQEIKLQQQLQAGRKRQIQNLGSQTYIDSEGRQRTFASMGVTKYAHYDFETGRITIDWEGLEALAHDPNKSEQGEAAEAYINMLQELVGSYEDTRDAIWEIEDTIEDLMHEAIDSYISFEERVMDALISRYEKQIDTLEAMNEAIDKAASDVIDSIQEQIAAQRQERQNRKTEESIAEKEARLAYLRRDTSGSNELEILQLEKEIEEARQNYEDSLIDQAIEEMRKDAELAAEQRAQQIEIMRAQLQVAIDEGTLWQEVYDLINSATDESGALDFNSELIRLLKEAEAFNALSAFASDEWIAKVGEEFRRAIEGLAAGNADQAGQHQGEGSGGGTGGGGSDESGPEAGGGGSSGGSSGGSTPSSYPYGKASETTGIIKKGSTKKKQVKAIQWALNELGYTDKTGKALVVDGIFGDKTDYAVTNFQNDMGLNGNGKVGDRTREKFRLSHYASGGLADFTGPAWLDGSKTNPELVLNPDDTRNFIALKNILAGLLNGQHSELNQLGNAYFDIDVSATIDSDYDVQRMVNEIKNEIVKSSSYRNVNTVNFVR